MTHVAMARIAIAKIQAFMTSLQGHIEACEQEKRVAKKVTSININCKERRWSTCLCSGEWSETQVFHFSPQSLQRVTEEKWLLTISSFWFCLKGTLAKPSNSARGPKAMYIYSPANPVERSFAFQSIHKNTTRLWSLKSVHSSLATFKAAFKEDKRHSLPSHRNTGIFRARHSHQRSTSPTQVGETQQGAQTKWRCQAKAGGSAPPGGGGGPDSWLYLVAVRPSPQKVISRVRQGPQRP